jgi:hypothetical protein
LRDRYRTWEEKYAVSLTEEAASAAARTQMWDMMRDMGYTD